MMKENRSDSRFDLKSCTVFGIVFVATIIASAQQNFGTAWIEPAIGPSKPLQDDQSKQSQQDDQKKELDQAIASLHEGVAMRLATSGANEERLAKLNEAIEAGRGDVEAYFDRAWIFVLQKDYQAAESDINEVIEIQPLSFEAHNVLGFVYFATNRPEKAIESFSETLRLAPEHVRAWRNRAGAYVLLKQFEKADADRDALRKLLVEQMGGKEAADLHVKWAMEYIDKSEFDYADIEFRQALLIKPNSVQIKVEQIRNQINLGQFEQAISGLDELKAKGYDFGDLHFLRGTVLLLQGETKEAIEFLSAAIEREPELAVAFYNRGKCYASLNEYEKAIADYSKSIELNPESSDQRNNRGVAYLNLKEYDKAIPDFEAVLENNPNYKLAHFKLGRIHSARGETELAIEKYSRVIEIDPSHTAALFYRGELFLEGGELEKAKADFTAQTALEPDSEDGWFRLGLSCTYLDEHEVAIDAYTKALELSPGFLACYNNRGMANSRLGKIDLAAKDWLKALEIDSTNDIARRNMVDLNFEAGEFEKAIVDLDALIELNKDDIQLWNRRGDAWDQIEEYHKAIADYDKSLSLDSEQAYIWYSRGFSAAQLDLVEDALNDYVAALELEPEWLEVHDAYAELLWGMSKFDESKAAYRKMIEIDPNAVEAYSALAWMLSTASDKNVRDGEAAVKYATKACELTEWNDGSCLDDLATAHAESGDFENALKYMKLAIANYKANNVSEEELPEDLLYRLDLFEESLPFHVD